MPHLLGERFFFEQDSKFYKTAAIPCIFLGGVDDPIDQCGDILLQNEIFNTSGQIGNHLRIVPAQEGCTEEMHDSIRQPFFCLGTPEVCLHHRDKMNFFNMAEDFAP